jgi:pimeloyl-ACP methyl ester carboxylesterase
LRLPKILLRFVWAAAILGASWGGAFAQDANRDEVACRAINKLFLDHARVISAAFDMGGAQISSKAERLGDLKFDLPPSCRVKIELTPTSDSHIEAEIWMPVTARWNGKLWSTGNGGLAGSIDELSMSAILSRGYVSSGSDTGHQASGIDGNWALGHPQKRIDYGYRAVHETAVKSKVLIQRFYGKHVGRSYFAGGSNGGRAALQEAQRYPEDYDGIEAGAPAFNGANTVLLWSWLEQQFQKPGARIPPEKLAAIAAAAMNECDVADGLKDGLIEDPRRCHVRPEVLLCRGEETNECLTPAQVASLKAIYEGPGGNDPAGYHYYGYSPGGELNWQSWLASQTSAQSVATIFATEFQRYLFNNDATWTFERFSLERDASEGLHRMEEFYEALDVDLSRFAARGGKLIIYHGWADPALQPQLSIDYYERVRERMRPDKAAKFMRLYMVPGMGHVFGGNGPNVFGQMLPPTVNSTSATSIGKALEAWVEEGIPPGPIIGAEHINDVKAIYLTDAGKPTRTRPICPYPQVARYRGAGSVDEAANFACVSP